METNRVESTHRSRIAILIFLLLSLIEGIFAFITLFNLPTDAKHAVFLGFSTNRLLLLSAILLGIVALFVLSLLHLFRPGTTDFLAILALKSWTGKIAALFGWILVLVLLVPSGAWGRFSAVQERLFPLLLWLCFLLLQWALLSLFLNEVRLDQVKQSIRKGFGQLNRIFFISLVILIGLYIASTYLYPGSSDEDFWYETSVPLLNWQILVAVIVGLVLIKLGKQWVEWSPKRVDLFLFLVLFLFFGVLWAVTPLTPSYFNVGPLTPDNQYYPKSDSAKFDLYAQSALVGLGFNNGNRLDRPYYPLLLASIHLVTGQDYAVNVAVQAFVLGFLPAIVYLICIELGSRRWGIASAVATGLWGINLIQVNNVLSTATQKNIMTDFPTAILVSLVIYFGIRWRKEGFQADRYALITGGMIALASYVRYSALVLLPILGLIVLLQALRKPKQWITANLVLFLGFMIVVAPWYLRDISAGRPLRPPFWGKIAFILRDRYSPDEIDYELNQGTLPFEPIEDPTLSADLNENDPENDSQIEYQGNDLSKPFTNWFSSHFIHNVMSSILILPSSLEISSLDLYLENAGDLWDPYWDGTMPLGRLLVAMGQFAMIAAGVCWIWKKDRGVAAVLLLSCIGLHITNALGRTSGGRYILPVIWIVIPMYFAGILMILRTLFVLEDEEETFSVSQQASKFNKWVLPMLVLLGIGLLPVLFEVITKQVIDPPAVFSLTSEAQIFESINLTEEEILLKQKFLQQEQTVLATGLAFYPIPEEIELNVENPSDIQEVLDETGHIATLTFELMTRRESVSLIFPHQDPINLINQDQVVLLGCNANKDTIVVRDLYLIRNEEVIHYESDIPFENCD